MSETRTTVLRLPDHGTRARYMSRQDPCHCDKCREANTRYMQIWRSKGPGQDPSAYVI